MDAYLNEMKENLIRTIIVSNEKRIDVFRIHAFEKSLKFDPHFAYGISQNDEAYNMVINIENLWKERKIELPEVFTMMVGILEKCEKHLEQFYFRPEELDISGKLLMVRSYSSYDDKNYAYFMRLKNKDNIKAISRQEFEFNMKNEEIANSYVENYSGKDAKFFNYRATGLKHSGKNCYFMFVNNNIKVGFVKS